MGTAARATARLAAIGERVRGRRGSGPTLGDLPHGHEIAEQLAVILTLQGSTDPGDWQRVVLAAEKAYVLIREDGPRLDMLERIARDEDSMGEHDPDFWAAVGGDETAIPRG